MRGVTRRVGEGRPVVEKRFFADDTERFNCLGSGAANEAYVPEEIKPWVPSVLYRRVAGKTECVGMEMREGRHLGVNELNVGRLYEAARVLAVIHGTSSLNFGSLDGQVSYPTQSSAFSQRWNVALDLLKEVDTKLSSRVEAWGRPRVRQLVKVVDGPRLVHGDFGPANLLWDETGKIVAVLDWEFSRYGDPLEDWAKVILGTLFPEPNGFGANIRPMVRHWRVLVGSQVKCVPWQLELYCAYIAASLGVFFAGEGAARLQWLAALVNGALPGHGTLFEV